MDIWAIVMLVAVVVGAVLRLWDIAGPSLSHPEIYIPGIDLPPGISEPPPRHGFLETLSWHFHSEPHPPGYYMAMWAWTKIFGTSVWALRLPDALLGILSIWLIWRLGIRTFDRKIAAFAAVLLALHGFHIYWSQMARMYAPGTALALLSTLALVAWMQSGKARPWLEAGYALTIIAGTQADELFWAIPFLQLAWVALVMPVTNTRPSWSGLLLPWSDAPRFRMLQVQALALALAAPQFVHSALHARGGAAPKPTPYFLMEYMGGGFLFETNRDFPSSLDGPAQFVTLAVVALTIALSIAACLRAGTNTSQGRPRSISFLPMLLGVCAGAAIALYLAFISTRHRHVLMLFALLPLLCLWLPSLAETKRYLLDRWLTHPMQWLRQLQPFTLLLLMLAFVPPILFYVASVKMSVLATRAFLLFAPFVIMLIAAGAMHLRSLMRWAVMTLLVVLCAASTLYFHYRPKSPRDYKGLALLLTKTKIYRPTDILLVRYRNWLDTPFFYYMPKGRYLTDNDSAYFRIHRPERVWLIYYAHGADIATGGATTRKRLTLLSSGRYRAIKIVKARDARAVLFTTAKLP